MGANGGVDEAQFKALSEGIVSVGAVCRHAFLHLLRAPSTAAAAWAR